MITTTPDAVLACVNRAAETDTALVVVVSAAGVGGAEAEAVSRRVEDYRTAGFTVLHLPWAPSEADEVYRNLDAMSRVSATKVLATLVDLELDRDSSAYAHFLAEVAWHAGSTVVVRLEGGATSAPSVADAQVLAALAYADVVVAPSPVLGALRNESPLAVLADLREEFGACDAWVALGPLDAPQGGPSLTVLVTTFARPRELHECLASLTRQTLASDRFDVVVVDDASPTDARAVVERFNGALHTTVIRLDVNSGPAAARAAGIAAATGEIVMLLDDDDVLAPRALAEHVRLHAAAPREHAAVLGHTVVRPSGEPDVLSRHTTRTGHQYFDYGSLRSGQVMGWAGFWAGRSSAKRSLLARHSFQGTFMEDTDFAWRADKELTAAGTPLEVHYARNAVQVMAAPLDLVGMRRRQVKLGWAIHDFEVRNGFSVDEQREEHLRALSTRSSVDRRLLDELPRRAADPLTSRRLGRTPAASTSALARLDALLSLDLTASEGSGFLAAERFAAVRSAGSTPVLAVDGCRPAALQAAAATRDGDPLRLVVVIPDSEHREQPFVEALTILLAEEGLDLNGVGDVEIRIGDFTPGVVADADYLIDPEGSHLFARGGAVPLLALTPAEWVRWFAAGGDSAGSLR